MSTDAELVARAKSLRDELTAFPEGAEMDGPGVQRIIATLGALAAALEARQERDAEDRAVLADLADYCAGAIPAGEQCCEPCGASWRRRVQVLRRLASQSPKDGGERELLAALKGLQLSMPDPLAPCHFGICPQSKCGYCSRIAAALSAIKSAESVALSARGEGTKDSEDDDDFPCGFCNGTHRTRDHISMTRTPLARPDSPKEGGRMEGPDFDFGDELPVVHPSHASDSGLPPADSGAPAETTSFDALRAKYKAATPDERVKMIHENDCPSVWAFFDKYALGPKWRPSCLVCGKNDYASVAIQHAELSGIIVCDSCTALRSPAPALTVESVQKVIREHRFSAEPKQDCTCGWANDDMNHPRHLAEQVVAAHRRET